MATEAGGKKKVAILGGGVGGMVTAYWLTSTQELRDQYDVTVYQLGWRLGGKGASGRNLAQGARIEEHGLHIWFGFYDNAFRTMRQCYDELALDVPRPDECPIRTFDDAFTPSPVIGLYEYYGNEWLSHAFNMPTRPSASHLGLGEDGPLPCLWNIVSNVIEWACETWESHRARLGIPGHEFPEVSARRFLHWSEQCGIKLDEFDAGVRERLLDTVQDIGRDLGAVEEHHEPARKLVHILGTLVLGPLVEFKKELWKHVVGPRLSDAELRLFFTTFDTFVTSIVGILEEGVVTRGFTSIDDIELVDFLRAHKAEPFTLELVHSPFLRGWYDAAFAYRCEGGKLMPDLAAGTGIHGILRLLGSYRREVAFKMRAGMGDTIFGPFYEVLHNRGVTFEFFREVTALELTDDRSSVGAIRVLRQAELVDGTRGYDPLVTVNHLPCWPSEPRWDQLVDGDGLREAGVEFEYGQSAPGATEQRLTLGEDFDTVVLAIPAPALAGICSEVGDQVPAFRLMLDNCHGIMTQAGQVWTTKPLGTLGARFTGDAIVTSFVEPIDTYCDMSHLLLREDWGDDPPLGVAYFCGAMPDQASQADADATAAEGLRDLLEQHATELWPAARLKGGGFDWSVLRDPNRATGPARLASQYVRANFVPTEHYVLSLAGSIKYRLREDALVKPETGPGIDNLYLAGDWTLNGINGGCVEAATMSGMRASRAICGTPAVVACENEEWLQGIEQ